MIELALLGLLSEQDLHGYELKKQLGELLGSWSALSYGSLYPALARLERDGLVRAADGAPDEPTPPMTGALSGELAAFRHRLSPKPARPRGRRGKKVYAITAAGRARFAELLTAPTPDDDRSFALRVAFCGHLDPADRVALFERRKAELATALATRRHRGDSTRGPRRSDPYLRSLRDRDQRTLTHDLAWIDELIAATHVDDAGNDAGAPPLPSIGPPPIPPSPSLSALGQAARASEAGKKVSP